MLLALIMDSCAYCATYQLEQKDNLFLSSSLILIGFSLCVQYSLSDKPWYFLCQIKVSTTKVSWKYFNSESNGCVIGRSSGSLVRLLSKDEDAKRAKRLTIDFVAVIGSAQRTI